MLSSGIAEEEWSLFPPWEIENRDALWVQGHSQGKMFIKHTLEMDVNSRKVRATNCGAWDCRENVMRKEGRCQLLETINCGAVVLIRGFH